MKKESSGQTFGFSERIDKFFTIFEIYFLK
jgi:hypothetical protein